MRGILKGRGGRMQLQDLYEQCKKRISNLPGSKTSGAIWLQCFVRSRALRSTRRTLAIRAGKGRRPRFNLAAVGRVAHALHLKGAPFDSSHSSRCTSNDWTSRIFPITDISCLVQQMKLILPSAVNHKTMVGPLAFSRKTTNESYTFATVPVTLSHFPNVRPCQFVALNTRTIGK